MRVVSILVFIVLSTKIIISGNKKFERVEKTVTGLARVVVEEFSIVRHIVISDFNII